MKKAHIGIVTAVPLVAGATAVMNITRKPAPPQLSDSQVIEFLIADQAFEQVQTIIKRHEAAVKSIVDTCHSVPGYEPQKVDGRPQCVAVPKPTSERKGK